MTAPRDRAFRFELPPRDGPERRPGLRLRPTGGVEMVEEDASIRQAILLLVSTRPGERIMRPGYGCDLGQLVFAPNDDTTAGLAVHYVRRAVEAWEPRVEVLSVNAARSPEDPGRLDISLEYRVRATQRRGRASLPFPLDGGVS
ncbi:MAG TPA: GPW/gp25 family protein [Anaeromyxobacter sp.]|nr:GPW/gp25 family protein [Anaeromyxobacter sp.]